MRALSMRRRALAVLAAWTLGGAWLGCNALLGNESAVFEPDGATGTSEGGSADGPGEEASRPDGSTAADADADADAPIVHPCTNTQNDTFNCGACGHDCLGGACNAGVCAPVVLANEPGEPVEIAVDGTHVYWTNAATGDVRRAPIGGGAAETIFDGPDGTDLAEGLLRVGNDLYFAIDDVNGGVYRCPVTGCGAGGPQLVVAVKSPGFMGLAAGNVLVVSEGTFDGRVGRCTLPCAGGLTFVTGAESFPKYAAVEGDAVYWSTLIPGPGNLRGKADDGSSETTLVPTQAVQQIAVKGSEVIFAARGSGVKGVPRAGGAIRRLYDPLTQSERFALDGNDVYFNDTAASTGRILKCALAGCGDAGTTMAALQARPHAIVVDSKSVYWTNRGDSNAGTIMRLAK